MSALKKLGAKFRHGTFLLWLTDRLMDRGLTFKLFYWVKEGVTDGLPSGLKEEDYRDFTFSELHYDDMENIVAADQDQNASLEYLQKNISTPGVKCFGMTNHEQIACTTWFNLNECESRFMNLPLEEDEVYGFDMYTMAPYRGRNLAPYLRLKAMEALKALGKEKFYSISDYLNPQSIRFKQKLNSEFLELTFLIRLFNLFEIRRRIK